MGRSNCAFCFLVTLALKIILWVTAPQQLLVPQA